MTTHINDMRARIADLEADNAQLEARYGTGVRPSWVGEEISMNLVKIRDYRRVIVEAGVDDAKRRASNAIIEALADNVRLQDIVELAMDDLTAPDKIQDRLAEIHDAVQGL